MGYKQKGFPATRMSESEANKLANKGTDGKEFVGKAMSYKTLGNSVAAKLGNITNTTSTKPSSTARTSKEYGGAPVVSKLNTSDISRYKSVYGSDSDLKKLGRMQAVRKKRTGSL